jgi:hypothetical protein
MALSSEFLPETFSQQLSGRPISRPVLSPAVKSTARHSEAQRAMRESVFDNCGMDNIAPMAQFTPNERIGELKMPGKVIPLSGRDSYSEKRSLLTDDDIRVITDLGNKLIHDGKASAIRRYTGQSGQDVIVILDDKGVIEFGIEKSEGGYKRFNCDCDTVATASELRPLLSDLS